MPIAPNITVRYEGYNYPFELFINTFKGDIENKTYKKILKAYKESTGIHKDLFTDFLDTQIENTTRDEEEEE